MEISEERSTVNGWMRSWKTKLEPSPSTVKPEKASMKTANRLGLLSVVLDSKNSF